MLYLREVAMKRTSVHILLFVIMPALLAAGEGEIRAQSEAEPVSCFGRELSARLENITLRKELSEQEKNKLAVLKKNLRADGFEAGVIESIFDHPEFGLYDISEALFRWSPERVTGLGRETYEWYRTCLGVDEKIKRAKEFMDGHKDMLADVEEKYGVSPRYIVSILGLESDFSKTTGKFKAVNSLVSQYLLIDERKKFAYRELGEIIRYSQKSGKPLFDFNSSYAGAVGCAQFIPSSLNSYFVGKRGRIEKADPYDVDDCVYSIAYYLKKSGWDKRRNEEPLVEGSRNWRAIRAYNPSDAYTRLIIEIAQSLKSESH